MVTIEVRRHAERASGADAAGGLSPAGLAMARRLRARLPGFALVISSPRQRARDTAIALAGRLDEADRILDVAPDQVLTQAQYDALGSQHEVAELMRKSAPTRRFAEDQLSLWERVASRVRQGESALLVTHGGNIELPAVILAARLDADVGPLPLTYCEGVRVGYEHRRPVALERLRAE